METAICKKFCSFYKQDRKEQARCGTYAFLKRNLTTGEIRQAASATPQRTTFSEDSMIHKLVCSKCEFLVDGCDYRDGAGKTPCGGYAIIEHLLKNQSPEAIHNPKSH